MIALEPAAAVAPFPAFRQWCIDDSPRGESPREAHAVGSGEAAFAAGTWVLVVEDDRDCRDTLELLLRASGCAVKSTVDGLQALEMLKNSPAPAVILLDNLMPGMTGEEFLEARKDDPRLAEIPVVMLSAWDKSTDGMPLKVDEFVQKPYDPERLLALVRRYLEH
jgi:CheY-like chemotaxis protein